MSDFVQVSEDEAVDEDGNVLELDDDEEADDDDEIDLSNVEAHPDRTPHPHSHPGETEGGPEGGGTLPPDDMPPLEDTGGGDDVHVDQGVAGLLIGAAMLGAAWWLGRVGR